MIGASTGTLILEDFHRLSYPNSRQTDAGFDPPHKKGQAAERINLVVFPKMAGGSSRGVVDV